MAESDSKPTQQGTLQRWSTIPTDLMGMLNPFSSNDGNNKPTSETDTSSQTSKQNKSFFASILPISSTPEPPSPEKEEDDLMFAEPDTQSNSDIASQDGSGKKVKKGNKPKTCYSLCHPAPASTTRHKLHRRPRSLLQLHRLSPNDRPQPAFEVVPSANFSVRLTKVIAKVFRTKHSLCPNDLVVMKAEKYSANEPDEEQEARDIIALICKGRKEDGTAPGKAKICLADGREWEAYPTPTGGYEFFSTDEHGLGLTVRWVPKKGKDGGKPTDSNKKKFNFSTISPNSRRHPVIATLSKSELGINDTYKMPDPAAATPLSTPKQGSTFLTDAMEDENDGKEQCETDDRLRQIITMTAIWVGFKEGWSPYFKYEDKEKDICGVQRSPSLQYSPSKSATFSSPVTTPPASPGVVPLDRKTSMKSVTSVWRKSSLLNRGNRSSTASAPEIEEETAPASPEMGKRTGRTRADSASTVLVHRAASNRAKHHQATWRPDLLSSQQEVSESSPASDRRVPAPDASPSPDPQRRESIARPILPPSHESGSGDGSAGVPLPRSVGQPMSSEKRESSTTTNSTSTTSEISRKVAVTASSRKKKRSGRLRRLLCGGNNDV